MAWVPIANIILMLKIPNMSLLWIIAAFLIPVIFVPVVYCRIAEERYKPSWLGILMLLPGINFIVLGYLAFSK